MVGALWRYVYVVATGVCGFNPHWLFFPAQRFTQILSLAVIFSMAILFAQGSNYLFFIGLVNIGLTLHSSPLYHSGKTLLPGSESQLIVMALIPHINRSKMRVDSTLLFWLALVKGETK